MTVDFSGFKLIIWDLDETLWEGILSEGTARLSRRNIDLISNIVSSGVMYSICSQNDKDEVMHFCGASYCRGFCFVLHIIGVLRGQGYSD